MNYAAFPYLRIALVFIAGIFAGEHFDFNLYSLILLSGSLVLIFTISYFLIKKYPLRIAYFQSIILLLLSFIIGISVITNKKTKINTQCPDFLLNKEMYFTGVIDEPPVLKNRLRCMIKIESIQPWDNNYISADMKIVAYFSTEDSMANKYTEGDKIRFKSKLKSIQKGANPEAFDFGSYLRYRSVIHQASVAPYEHELIRTKALFFYRAWAADLRQKCLDILYKYIDSDKELAIAQAVILGYRNLISDELYQDFTDSGAVHVLAVSGLHVAIVISLFTFLFDKIRKNSLPAKVFKIMVLILIVWTYVFMTGASPAVMRAGLMVSLFIVGKYSGGSTNIYNILSISAILLLMLDPFLLFQASFQFSYLALISIVYFQPHVQNLLAPSHKVLQYGWNLISVAIAAQILVFPVTIYYFHKFPVYFMLTGLVAIPLVFLLLYCGLLMLVFEFIFPLLNIGIAPVFKFLLKIFVTTIQEIKNLPYSSMRDIWIDEISFILLYLAIFAMMLYLNSGKSKFLWSIMGLLTIFLSYESHKTVMLDKQKKIFFYDVYGGILVDYFEGKVCHFIKSGNVDDKAIAFAAQNNRMKHGIKSCMDVSKKAYYINGDFEKFRNHIRLGEHHHYFLSDNLYHSDLSHKYDIVCPLKNINRFNNEDIPLPEACLYFLSRDIKPWIRSDFKNKLSKQSLAFHEITSGKILHIDLKHDSICSVYQK